MKYSNNKITKNKFNNNTVTSNKLNVINKCKLPVEIHIETIKICSTAKINLRTYYIHAVNSRTHWSGGATSSHGRRKTKMATDSCQTLTDTDVHPKR